ncbi:SMP-30/gluconolactonase/LRE family protein [Fodinicola feengrottensis]|uniref:SMP-30/gluconolactonase/LRE family protein n=1 Tax=Fodinicola feengrottensis TaxID=435914 RepID=UPI0013D86D7A|nr:SMP-30/gluconolactonase/LRE family protein [Fodinicola feengrottensis]
MLVQDVRGPVCDLGEGPWWDARTHRLVWVDLLAGFVHMLDPGTEGCRTVVVGQPVSAVVRAGENWLLTVETGFELRDPEWKTLSSYEIFRKPTKVRMNDAGCDPAGRLYAGSLAYDDREGLGCLYRLDQDGGCHELVTGLGISNGLAWSPDHRTMYHVDSAARVIYAREYDETTGSLGGRRQSFIPTPTTTRCRTGSRSTRRAACGWRSGTAAG